MPAGFDPIFNPAANSKTDGSHIKIKPMRLSKGFDEINNRMSEVFESSENSNASYPAVFRGQASIGTLESHSNGVASYDLNLRGHVEDKRSLGQSTQQVSPIYGKEVKSEDQLDRKRNSRG